MNDYEAHLGSYDHSHRQRMKDMKQMVKDPTAGARARKAEAKADGLISIKLGGDSNTTGPSGGGGSGSGGFKKGGFKKSGFKSAFTPIGGAPDDDENSKPKETDPDNSNSKDEKAIPRDLNAESDTEDEGYEAYNPRFPTE